MDAYNCRLCGLRLILVIRHAQMNPKNFPHNTTFSIQLPTCKTIIKILI